MKIKNIAALCKKSKHVILYSRTTDAGYTEQYIGDGYALYLLEGLPPMNLQNIQTIFDISDSQVGKWTMKEEKVPEGMNIADTDSTEKLVEPERMKIVYGGDLLIPLKTVTGMVFINENYLSPMGDTMDAIELYQRRYKNGNTYIVAKAGFMLQAAIMPFDMITEEFVSWMKKLTDQCAMALLEKENQRAKMESQEYSPMIINPETGEVWINSQAGEGQDND